MTTRNLAVVVFDGVDAFHLTVPDLVLGGRNGELSGGYAIKLCGLTSGPVSTAQGFQIEPIFGLPDIAGSDVVIVPSWLSEIHEVPDSLSAALREAYENQAILVGFGLGAFVIAAGLLDGRRATTHWRWADAFSRRFPQVRLESEHLYISDENLITSAGNAASLDCCIQVYREHQGAEAASRLAKQLLTAPNRSGDQTQFVEKEIRHLQKADRLSETIEWARQTPEGRHTIQTLADRAGLAPRTFTRQFQKRVGSPVKKWLIVQRLEHARRLLESSDMPIGAVATAVGFSDSLSLRQHFLTRFKTTPSQYRNSFRASL
ncbi:GlxA family transcriptional regulator [Paraburkholderia caribensis]|uniref:GlxA family transcriptional regulator n=1 Tax=Paraburkholderia caribensis TaxID=75105 RepID=UPI00078C7814|nr:helix-turn-helix domain-containing protein [Paraburkholderia caribensis]AMV48443.1 hypothetical protein ATN79_48205 [Paraburkholderia caribensis]